MGTAPQVVDWAGGSLDDLISLMSGPAWSARIEVLPANGANPIGEVHVIAGGVSEALFEGKSTNDALDRLRGVKSSRFRIEPRLPNPTDGDLTFPGPDQGTLEGRPLAQLMRYCETYVLTVSIEVWRGNENARVEYRRGEIPPDGVTVGGIDAPERLAEVMRWSSGRYRLIVPKLSLPATAPPRAAAPPAPTPRPAAAPSAVGKTIFGIPAVDAASLAAAAEKIKSGALPQAPVRTPASTPLVPPGPIPPRTATPASGSAQGRPAASVPATEAGRANAAPTASAAPAKTIIGVQSPGPTPPASTPSPASPLVTAGTSPAGSPSASPPASTSPAAGASPAAAAARAPTAEPTKPRKGAAGAGEPPAAATAARAALPTVPATGTTQGGAPAEGERTLPTKAAPAPKPKPNETPVWTYVGVGFVFGLALLGIYRLVIVLAP